MTEMYLQALGPDSDTAHLDGLYYRAIIPKTVHSSSYFLISDLDAQNVTNQSNCGADIAEYAPVSSSSKGPEMAEDDTTIDRPHELNFDDALGNSMAWAGNRPGLISRSPKTFKNAVDVISGNEMPYAVRASTVSAGTSDANLDHGPSAYVLLIGRTGAYFVHSELGQDTMQIAASGNFVFLISEKYSGPGFTSTQAPSSAAGDSPISLSFYELSNRFSGRASYRTSAGGASFARLNPLSIGNSGEGKCMERNASNDNTPIDAQKETLSRHEPRPTLTNNLVATASYPVPNLAKSSFYGEVPSQAKIIAGESYASTTQSQGGERSFNLDDGTEVVLHGFKRLTSSAIGFERQSYTQQCKNQQDR